MENLQQIGLFETPAPFQRSSRTSKAAAKAIQPKAPTKRAIVLAFVKGRALQGATNNEIAECNGMKLQTVCPRVNELTTKYLLRDSGKTRDGSTVWIAV